MDEYLLSVLPPRNPVLKKMEAVARVRGIPIVGPAVGRLLAQYVRLTGARRIFELGSAIGYSTMWLAQAAGPEGMVFYTDSSEENAREAGGYFEEAGLSSRITVLTGDALSELAKTDGEFDIIFNDVDKEGYPDVFAKALPRLRTGGLLISDNVLWSGRLRLPPSEDDAETAAIRAFNAALYASPDVETVILPLRDGVSVARKIR
jgi:predicted O-methyltransferase YrrM